MDYGVGELDYGGLEDDNDVIVIQSSRDLVDLTGDDDDDDELVIIDGGPEDDDDASHRAITPEPDEDLINLPSIRRDGLRISPAESIGDSGIESTVEPSEDGQRSPGRPTGISRSPSTSASVRESISPEFGVRRPRPSVAGTAAASLQPVLPKPKRCRLAYQDIPGYPYLQRSYKFLRPTGRISERHQLLHLCHDQTEKELMARLELIVRTFDYQKMVIFARRKSRLVDIKVTLKRNLGLDSLFLEGTAPAEKVEKVCSWFAKTRRRILVCSTQIRPSTQALTDVNLIIWWNLPYTVDDFTIMTDRLSTDALILVILKQDEDWQFLYQLREQVEVILPEIDVDSPDPAVAGFINSAVRQRKV